MTTTDVAQLRLAQAIFHGSSFVPLLLYHMKLSDDQPKFPATISYSIRHGVPRWAHHAIWLAGWAVMLRMIRGPAGDASVRAFGYQMVATGVVAVILCPLGQGKTSDRVHFFTSGMCVDVHCVLRPLPSPKILT